MINLVMDAVLEDVQLSREWRLIESEWQHMDIIRRSYERYANAVADIDEEYRRSIRELAGGRRDEDRCQHSESDLPTH